MTWYTLPREAKAELTAKLSDGGLVVEELVTSDGDFCGWRCSDSRANTIIEAHHASPDRLLVGLIVSVSVLHPIASTLFFRDIESALYACGAEKDVP